MSRVIQEWLNKAESDWRTANFLWSADEPTYDAVCFHAQQCAEKMMKALLIQAQQVAPYTHNLVLLHNELLLLYPNWDADPLDLHFLTRGSTVFRYPGEDATEQDAEASLRIAAILRDRVSRLITI